MKHLLIIDDLALRQSAFQEAGKILKKMDRLESQLATFLKEDQRLYSNWYDLTFRKSHEKIAKLHAEYLEMAQTHNHIVALSKMLDLDMPEAWLYLRNEELRFAAGSESEREKISQEKIRREEFMKSEMDREFGQSDDDDRLDSDRADEQEAEEANPTRRARTQIEEKEWNALKCMRDKKLVQICRDHDQAHVLIWTVLELARTDEDHLLLLRIWSHLPHKHQVSFMKVFQKQTGLSFKSLLDEIAALAEADKATEDQDQERFQDEFLGIGSRQETPKMSAESIEVLKILYRQLVRRLHPDRLAQNGEQDHWEKKIWNRVQEAYRKKHLPELKRIWHLVLIRSGDLRDLAISEVREIQQSLKSEYDMTEQEIADLKSQPAWGFSRRKSLGPLERKIQKVFDQDASEILDRLEELKAQHRVLEILANVELNLQKKRSRRKSSSKKRPARKPKKTNQVSENQASLFESE